MSNLSLPPDIQKVAPDPIQGYSEATREITRFLKSLEDQIEFLRGVARQKEGSNESSDEEPHMVGVNADVHTMYAHMF